MSWSKVEEYKKRNKWKKPLLGIIGAAAFVMLASYTVKAEEIVDQDEEVISDTVGIVEDEGTSFIETEDTEETVETPERVEKPDAEAVEDNTEDLNSQVKEEENTIEKGWVSENGSKYYLDEKGERCTGWLLQDEGWYYLDAEKDGAMFDAGWKYINSRWYYFNDNGVMKTGWLYYGEHWYYLSSYGDMSVDEWDYINSKWYHFYNSGEMETGWTYYKNNWYYLSPYGDMSVNEWDYINSNWYYFDKNGIMQTGWFLYNGNWYYLYPANNNAGKSIGAMAQNTTIDGYFISQDGIWINDEAYQGAYSVLNQVGWNLWSAYNWSANLPYVNYSNDPSPGSRDFAIHGFQTKTGDCYVMAATFYYMAKALGYDAHQIAGYVPLRGGGQGVHSWVEIDMDGSTYVFDPDFTHETKRNGYQITYGMSGTWRYSNYYRMN
jgi:glucan-binding YG repeat protein